MKSHKSLALFSPSDNKKGKKRGKGGSKLTVMNRTVISQACNTGYGVLGLVVWRMENGEWQGEDSTCIETAGIRCPILENPVNGRVLMSNGFGGGAIFTCNAGLGFAVQTCGILGEWSGGPVTCERKYNFLDL